jgi:hypothetical protein
MWALREVPNETTGVAPFVLVYGHLPKGPLAILKEHWCGETDLPLNLGKSTTEYLKDLRKKLETLKLTLSYIRNKLNNDMRVTITCEVEINTSVLETKC